MLSTQQPCHSIPLSLWSGGNHRLILKRSVFQLPRPSHSLIPLAVLFCIMLCSLMVFFFLPDRGARHQPERRPEAAHQPGSSRVRRPRPVPTRRPTQRRRRARRRAHLQQVHQGGAQGQDGSLRHASTTGTSISFREIRRVVPPALKRSDTLSVTTMCTHHKHCAFGWTISEQCLGRYHCPNFLFSGFFTTHQPRYHCLASLSQVWNKDFVLDFLYCFVIFVTKKNI